MNWFKSVLRFFGSHKKLTASILGAAVNAIPNLPADVRTHVTAVAVAYVVGQGLADTGKEAAKIAPKPYAPRRLDADLRPIE